MVSSVGLIPHGLVLFLLLHLVTARLVLLLASIAKVTALLGLERAGLGQWIDVLRLDGSHARGARPVGHHLAALVVETADQVDSGA